MVGSRALNPLDVSSTLTPSTSYELLYSVHGLSRLKKDTSIGLITQRGWGKKGFSMK